MSLWTCHIRLMGLPKSMNGFRFRRQNYAIEKRKWFNAIQNYFITNRLSVPKRPLEKCEINYILGSCKVRDYDNLVSSFKVITDCLVRHGIIEDDNPGVIRSAEYKQVKARQSLGFVEIEIKEVSCGSDS